MGNQGALGEMQELNRAMNSSDDGNDAGNNSQAKQHWQRIVARLRAEFGEDLYSSWFARLEFEELSNNRLVLSVPTRFLRNWIESHYIDRLTRTCMAELGPLDSVVVRVRTRGLPKAPASPNRLPARQTDQSDETLTTVRPLTQPRQTGNERGSALDHNLTFETYVLGQSNALAHAAALRVADAQPGAPVSFNPLFIHSAAGLGKTHLLNAIAWRIRQQQAGRKVLFISAERFMYHFIAALKSRDTLSFKDEFQNIDVLLIDDFQFLQGKSMQQEFCHTFNSLVDAKRQVIIAADVPPAQLESIDQRMRSRLAGGLVVDIETPELELRRQILQARLSDARRKDPRITICDEVIEFIANRIPAGGRELDGALNRVVASQQVTGARMTVDLAAMALRDLAKASEMNRVRIDDILRIIGRHYNVPRADLLSPRRARSIVRPRQVGMYLAKKLTPRSLPEIGRRFGGRDHSTVLHAVRKIEDLLKTDEQLAREVNLLAKLIEQN
jgi:chromosomal replication initiator protein